jgi:two-component system response regulator (stage 0 sporulation protein F)
MHKRPIRILIADDERNIRRLYEKEFVQEGYEVILAENGAQAVEKVRTENPDLVILDIRMPGMDGIEALGKILGVRADLPVVLNTAFTSYQQNFMSWAADAYVIKSPDLTELKSRVREILSKKGLIEA